MSMTDRLLQDYATFHKSVENTPDHLPNMAQSQQRLLHAAIGLATESAELLDVMKKHLYGKQKPIDEAVIANLREECGDLFYYLWLALSALDYQLDDMLSDNVAKLSKRYNKGGNTNA